MCGESNFNFLFSSSWHGVVRKCPLRMLRASVVWICPGRIPSFAKIAKEEGDRTGLYAKIAEPHPVFYKDSESREGNGSLLSVFRGVFYLIAKIVIFRWIWNVELRPDRMFRVRKIDRNNRLLLSRQDCLAVWRANLWWTFRNIHLDFLKLSSEIRFDNTLQSVRIWKTFTNFAVPSPADGDILFSESVSLILDSKIWRF